MTLYGDRVDVAKLPIEAGPISEIRISDFNQDSYSDILLVSGDMNVLSIVYGTIDGLSGPSEYFTIEEAGNGRRKYLRLFQSQPKEYILEQL